MDREEMDAKAKLVRDKIQSERVDRITKGLLDNDLLPQQRVDDMKGDMLDWHNEQLEAMERFIDMAVSHAMMKKSLHEAKIELQASKFDNAPKLLSQERFEKEMEKVAELGNKREHLKEVVDVIKGRKPATQLSPEMTQKILDADDDDIEEIMEELEKLEANPLQLPNTDPVTAEEAHELAHKMLEARLITDSSINEQVEELLKLDRSGFQAMQRALIRKAVTNPPPGAFPSNEDKAAQEDSAKLAEAMRKAGLITLDSVDQQVEEMKTWSAAAFKSMWKMVDKATHFDEPRPPMVQARKWGPGSEIAKDHHDRQAGGLSSAIETLRKYVHDSEVVIDEPNPRKSIKEAFEEVQDKKSNSAALTLKPYHKRGSIKDRKEESDKKTTQEPVFIRELREARELLEKFDETFVNAKVEMMKAKEAMLSEEHSYDGSKLHEDTSNIHALTKAQLTAQRDFAIIDKVYKQAFKKFAQIDVEQASVAELNKIMENYQAADEHTDLDTLFGGKYRTGDDNFYKWLARKKKFLSAEEAAEMFTDMVSSFPSEVAEAFTERNKRSKPAVAPHTKMY